MTKQAIKYAFYNRFGRVPGHNGDCTSRDVRYATLAYSRQIPAAKVVNFLDSAAWWRERGDFEQARTELDAARWHRIATMLK